MLEGLIGAIMGTGSMDMCIGSHAGTLSSTTATSTSWFPPMGHSNYSPSTIRAMESRIKNLERKEKMKETLAPRKTRGDWDTPPKEFRIKKLRTGWAFDPHAKPDEPDPFKQLYNHDFHKLLANFDALLKN